MTAPERIDKHAAAVILGCSPAAVVSMATRGDLAPAGAAKISRAWTFDERRLRAHVRKSPLKVTIGDVYVVGFNIYVKIGFTIDFQQRLHNLQTGIPEKLITYGLIEGVEQAQERHLHERFSAYRLEGEWFRKEADLAAWIEVGCPR